MNNSKPYEKYKPSGIAWLSDIPEHWEVRKLKYLAICFPSNVDKHTREGESKVRLCNYTDVYKNDFISDKMKFMEATASNEQIQKFTLLKDDIIITKDSETSNDIAVPAMVSENLTNVICGYHLSVIRSKKDINSEYLFRLFQHKKFNSQFEICSNGVTRVGLGVYDLLNAFGIQPPFAEQTAIANFLDYKLAKIDRFIKKKKQLIKLLNEQKAGIINDAVTKGLDANVKMKPSGIEWLGDIPENWTAKPLNYLASIIDGDRGKEYPNDHDYQKNGIPFLSSKNIINNKFDFNNLRFISTEKFDALRSGKLNRNDIVITVRGTIGSMAIFNDEKFTTAFINAQMMIIRPKHEMLTKYLHYFGYSKIWKSQLDYHAYGSAQQQLSNKILKKIIVSIPGIEEQKNIIHWIDNASEKLNKTIATIEKEIKLVQEYRTTLIAEAVTGKIDVRGYDIPVLAEMDREEEMEEELEMVAEDGEAYETSEIE